MWFINYVHSTYLVSGSVSHPEIIYSAQVHTLDYRQAVLYSECEPPVNTEEALSSVSQERATSTGIYPEYFLEFLHYLPVCS